MPRRLSVDANIGASLTDSAGNRVGFDPIPPGGTILLTVEWNTYYGYNISVSGTILLRTLNGGDIELTVTTRAI